MTLADLKINPLFENLLPPLTNDEFVGLEDDIVKRRKILNPILVWRKGNYIVDGHNRYKILIAHKMDTNNIVAMDFETESEAMTWIVDSQFAKRNLTKSQKVILLKKVEEQVQREAKERQAEYYGNQHDGGLKSNLTEVQNKPVGETAEIMARKLGVSKNTYKDMKTIVEYGSREKIARMDKGGKGNGVSAIAREIREGIPDGQMKCRRCGEAKPIEAFKKGDCICKKCYNEEEVKRRALKKEEKTLDGFLTKGSVIPRPGYYDTETPMQWTFDDVKVELEAVLKQTVFQIKNIFDLHKKDVFSEDDSIFLYTKELRNFMDDIKKVEREINNARSRKETIFGE